MTDKQNNEKKYIIPEGSVLLNKDKNGNISYKTGRFIVSYLLNSSDDDEIEIDEIYNVEDNIGKKLKKELEKVEKEIEKKEKELEKTIKRI